MDWLKNDDESIEVLGEPWNILIVDDDIQIHQVTQLALKSFKFDNRPLKFVSVYSGQEARELLDDTKDKYAIILLDVVMEANDSGLELANYIRNTQNNHYSRIILRTGQAGMAPEYSVIKNYDIDAYKSKTELKLADLEAVFYTTLRSYRDIITIKNQRESLQQVVSSITHMNSAKDLPGFASAIFDQIQLLIGCEKGELLLENSESYAICKNSDTTKILAVSHNDESNMDKSLQSIIDSTYKSHDNYNIFPYFVHFLKTLRKNEIVLSLKCKREITEKDSELLNLFSQNVAITYENLLISEELNTSQNVLVSLLSAAMESSSEETSIHNNRIGELSVTLGELSGMDSDTVDKLRIASQLHDIGKIAISDDTLNKPGKLNDEEWIEVKEHTTVGYNILKSSEIPLLKMASNIIYEHHERWDGMGYPNGKREEEISLEARLVAIIDVFDALLSRKCYKEAWDIDSVTKYLTEQKGVQFDPELLELFISNIDTFYKQYKDLSSIDE